MHKSTCLTLFLIIDSVGWGGRREDYWSGVGRWLACDHKDLITSVVEFSMIGLLCNHKERSHRNKKLSVTVIKTSVVPLSNAKASTIGASEPNLNQVNLQHIRKFGL